MNLRQTLTPATWHLGCNVSRMPVEKQFPVYGDNGLRGTLVAASRFLDNTPEKKVRLEDGREITVPSELLEARRDGSFYLHSAPESTSSNMNPPNVNQVAQPAVMPPTARTEPTRMEAPYSTASPSE